jgi:hypothetical protein
MMGPRGPAAIARLIVPMRGVAAQVVVPWRPSRPGQSAATGLIGITNPV